MIDGSQKRIYEGGFWTLRIACFWKAQYKMSRLFNAYLRSAVIYKICSLLFIATRNLSFFSEAQFKRRSFHVPNLIPSIKYMRRSTFESINLGRPWIKPSSPHKNFDCEATSFQTSSFSCAVLPMCTFLYGAFTKLIWQLVFATSTFLLKLVVEWRRLPLFPAKMPLVHARALLTIEKISYA